MEYPKNHKQINSDLLSGKFLLSENDNTGFNTVKHFEERHEGFYSKFFELSFGYELIINQEYVFLQSDETNESLSRDICIFFAILCYEIDKEGKNFLDEIKYSEFDYDYLDNYFDNSAYSEHIQTNNRIKDRDARDKFIKELYKRNIVNRTGEDRFTFTVAARYFLDFAKNLAETKLSNTN
jgi:hypothetical protein